MSKPPLIRAVEAKPPATLEIAWSTGEKLTADVSRLMKRFKLYAPLRNAALFGRAKADPWGHSVNWPGDIDMGADQLYELACEQAGKWGRNSSLPGWRGTAFRSMRRPMRLGCRVG